MSGAVILDSPAVPLTVRDGDGALAVMPSVYSVPFDETNTVFESYRFPRHLYSTTATRDDFDAHLASLGAGPLPVEGERKLGLLDLVHAPLVDAILTGAAKGAPGLDAAHRRWRYPLHGSSWGITVLMSHLANRLGVGEVRVLAGDYEGYAAQAANAGLGCRPGTLDELASGRGETWFVSNPSAVDGAPLPAEALEVAAARHRLVVDVAYHGLAGDTPVPVPADAWAVLWSLSKPWGLFWRRVGALACVEEVPCAYGTRWFKDPERLAAALVTVSRFEPWAMSERYRWAQTAAVDALGGVGVVAHPSPTLLLASVHRDEVAPEIWDEVARCERVAGSGVARVCLTPLIEQLVTG